MAVRALLGLQWGDEGKGKVVDALCDSVDVVVRAQGGANAGHTVRVGDTTRVLHLVPSGMLVPGVRGIIGHGVVLDPIQLVRELDELAQGGIPVEERMLVSERAHLVLDYHKAMDVVAEELREGSPIGTTRRGIGPAYKDKAARTGITADALRDRERFIARVREELAATNRLLRALRGEDATLDADAVLEGVLPAQARLAPLIGDGVATLHEDVAADREVLIEGAQGALLDLDLGTYPYVTSSNCTLGGLLAGSGIPPRAITSVIGVVKAYCTRVGSGPFPTEDAGDEGDRLRKGGHEFGATTGRPRRCGWLDLAALAFAVRTNGVDTLALTKLDVLSGFERIRLGTAYKLPGGERTERWLPSDRLAEASVEWDEMSGFSESVRGIRSYEELPPAAHALVERIEAATGARVAVIGTGPEREESVSRGSLDGSSD